jgi:hypothetical protein
VTWDLKLKISICSLSELIYFTHLNVRHPVSPKACANLIMVTQIFPHCTFINGIYFKVIIKKTPLRIMKKVQLWTPLPKWESLMPSNYVSYCKWFHREKLPFLNKLSLVEKTFFTQQATMIYVLLQCSIVKAHWLGKNYYVH